MPPHPPPTVRELLASPRTALWLAPLAVVLVAWVFPLAAIVTVWPVLFLVPGWLMVRRWVPHLTPVGQLGAGISLSVLVSAHLVNALGTVLRGVDVPLMLACAVLLWWLSVWLLLDEPAVTLRLVSWWERCTWHRHQGAWLVCALIVAVTGTVLQRGTWHPGPDGMIAGGWNWSDLLVHVSIATSTVNGNFPPQVPFYAGVPLTYHWFGDFHAGIAAAVAGVDVIPVMVFSSTVLTGALALVVWELAWRLLRSSRAAWVAALLAVLGGGLGWVRLPIDVHQGKGGWWDLLAQHSYDNAWTDTWPYFRVASVFGTGILDQRATTYGLPIMVTAILLLHVSWRRARLGGVVLTGCVAALLAPFDFFLFPCVYAVMGVQLIARRFWRDLDATLRLAALAGPVVLGLAFILPSVLQQHASGQVQFHLGWPEARPHDGVAAVAFFYITNFGVPFVLALVALLQRRLPHRWFLAGWIAVLFAVPNFVTASAISFDMNKLFQAMWIGVAIAAAWQVRNQPGWVLAPVLLVSMLSPLAVGVWQMRSTQAALSYEQVAAAQWIAANTPRRSVFVTDAFINSPVDLAGRLRLSSFGPYVTGLGYDPSLREAQIHSIYCDGDEAAALLMQQLGAQYVLSSGGLLDCGTGGAPTQFSSALFEQKYSSGVVSVWALRGAASP